MGGDGYGLSVRRGGEPTVDTAEIAGRFGHLLHAAGVPVAPGTSGRFAAALALARPARVDELYWLARVTLVSERAHLDAFQRVFDDVFGAGRDVADIDRNPDAPASIRRPDERTTDAAARSSQPARHRDATAGGHASGGDRISSGRVDSVQVAASATERLRHRTFATCTADELEQLRILMGELVLDPPLRRSRRSRLAPRGAMVDLRETLRVARRTGGDPARIVRRRRRTRMRRIILIADVSGSMEPYGRAYLYLLHGAVRAVRAEAFVFATRLHRLTGALRASQPAVALGAAMSSAPDWAGGTRLGESIKAFNDGWARRGLARGAVVVIVSDGWESGAAALLGQEMERLARLAHRIVWVNPRKQSDAYQPLTGGMVAALPHVDAFVSGHDLAAFAEVIAAINSGG